MNGLAASINALLNWVQHVWGKGPTPDGQSFSELLLGSLNFWSLLEGTHLIVLMLFAGTIMIVDLRLLGCVFRTGGEVAATAAGAATMGHPAAAVAWLANRLGARGQCLRRGQLVLSGGLTAPVPLEPGTAVTAEFDGLGSVEVYCR